MFRKLAEQYPGIEPWIDRAIAIAIDGVIYRDTWGKELPEDAEIFLLPRLAGDNRALAEGCGQRNHKNLRISRPLARPTASRSRTAISALLSTHVRVRCHSLPPVYCTPEFIHDC
ncbi:hypothetical protein [Mesorhizobium sp. B1-1-5]|uniref:hypothetical protein n=1 Tax=Mesorhizobium sp. B1-1-5 TaxID=2589979 RepID=UPI001FEFB8BB|nr:hypothetical protein [Mesorhizobium sp. B1-1-5]